MSIRGETRYRNFDRYPSARSHELRVPARPGPGGGAAALSGPVPPRDDLTAAAAWNALRLGLAAVILVGLLLIVFTPGADAGQGPAPTVEHVVRQGDTLWSIAEIYTPSTGDPRRTVSLIRRANAMPSPLLTVGEVVQVPVGDIEA